MCKKRFQEAVITREDDGSLSAALHLGEAEWSLPAQGSGSIPFAFSTPNIRTTTQGGLVTVGVQQTLAKLTLAPKRSHSFLVRTSLHAKTTPGRTTSLLETFCVHEGDLTVEYRGSQSSVQKKIVSAGECLGFLDGQLRTMGGCIRSERLASGLCGRKTL